MNDQVTSRRRQHGAVAAEDHIRLDILGAHRVPAAPHMSGPLPKRQDRLIQYPVNSSVRMSSSSTPAEFNKVRIAVTIPGGPHR